VLWDHDLFGSCAIRDPDSGGRLYPAVPNDLTPLPRKKPWIRWVVVSQALADEAKDYPTDAEPLVLRNVLPQLPTGGLDPQHERFMRQHGLTLERPILLDPVRVFQVKGVDIALRLLAAAKATAAARGVPAPVLVVFGSLEEDPEYAEQMLALAHELELDSDVRFLDGVPLSTHADANGDWQLDEIDLLRLASASGGGVVFTPGVPDVETVGLGPALAAAAGLPCAVTSYNAFDGVYQRSQRFSHVHVGSSPEAIIAAGAELLDALAQASSGDPQWAVRRDVNRQIVGEQFPTGPWRGLWEDLAAACGQRIASGAGR
jgi:glycosyltransferase involved in cell wall biosynthesis